MHNVFCIMEKGFVHCQLKLNGIVKNIYMLVMRSLTKKGMDMEMIVGLDVDRAVGVGWAVVAVAAE